MNYMKEVAKLLCYEIGEEFNIIYDNGEYSPYNPFKFIDTDLIDKDGDNSNDFLISILTGYYTIEKITFVPKMGDEYWTYYCYEGDAFNLRIVFDSWENLVKDKIRKQIGIVFRTEQEAKDYLPTWHKRLEGGEL